MRVEGMPDGLLGPPRQLLGVLGMVEQSRGLRGGPARNEAFRVSGGRVDVFMKTASISTLIQHQSA